VFFSHNKLANNDFSHDFLDKRIYVKSLRFAADELFVTEDVTRHTCFNACFGTHEFNCNHIEISHDKKNTTHDLVKNTVFQSWP